MKFKLFGRLKDGDQEEKQERDRDKRPSGNSIPQEKIESLSQRGLSENEIRDELRDAGYSHQQIDSALNQTVKRNAVSGSNSNQRKGGGGSRGGSPGQSPPSLDEGSGASSGADQGGFSPFSGSQEPQEPGSSLSGGEELGGLGTGGQGGGGGDERGEGRKEDLGGGYPDEGGYSGEEVDAAGVPSNARELIEIMVAEELSDIDERFDQIHSRMGKLEESVSSLEEKVNELSTRRKEDEKEFLKRIKDMEGYLKESQSTVGGLKKTMQDVLPALSRNIKEMNKIVEEKKD